MEEKKNLLLGVLTAIAGVSGNFLEDLARIISIFASIVGIAFIGFQINRMKRKDREEEIRRSGEYTLMKKDDPDLTN